MAIGGVTSGVASGSYRDQWNNKDLLEEDDEKTEGTGSTDKTHVWNAVFEEKKTGVTADDFLTLMVAQLTNQDFMNPADNSDMVNSMVQYSNMQAMQDMLAFSKTSYAMSLVGKTVTAARFTVSGGLDTTTGPIEKVSLVDDKYIVYVNGKTYELHQIMEIGAPSEEKKCEVTPTAFKLEADSGDYGKIHLKWECPTESETTAAGLKYSVYYSKEGPFDTLEEVEKGTLYGVGQQKDFLEETLTGLEPGTTYYLNVVVTDSAGNKAVYKPVSTKTKEQ